MRLPQSYKLPNISTVPKYILGIAILFSSGTLQAQQIKSHIDARLACQALNDALNIRPAITAAFLSEPIPFSRLNKHLEAMGLMLNNDLPQNLIHVKPSLRSLDLANSALRNRQPTVIKVQNSLRDLIKLSSSLKNQANAIAAREAATSASSLRFNVARRLGLLSEDFSKHAMGIAAEEISPESVFELGKCLNWFERLLRGLIEGSDELKIIATNDTQQKAMLQRLSEDYYLLRGQAGQALSNLQELVSAREDLKRIRTIAGNLAADFYSVCHQK
jgi:hypothetical protein